MKYADLHLHTNFSDGSSSVKDLIENAKKAGLSCISITDHDTVKGVLSAIESFSDTIEIIPGIELTADIYGREVHILGYFIDCKNSEFIARLTYFRKVRLDRIFEMSDKLRMLGVVIDPKEVIDFAHGASIGRLHLARIMVKKGIVSTTNEAFQKYIGDTCPAYVSKFKLTPKEAIDLILSVKGIPVIAHPYVLPSQDLIEQFVKDGLRGIEVYYPEHNSQMTENYKKIAEKYNLLITGGSDCHGLAKKEVLIGRVKIPYRLVEKLKEAKNAL
ncbi:MAG: PHP domain-containing protein [Candidatus Omnitrophota bacterium]